MLLCLGAIIVLVGGLWIRNKMFAVVSSIVTLLGAGVLLATMVGHPAQDAFNGLIVFDSLGLFFAIFSVIVVLFGVLLSMESKEIYADRRPEYFSILLALCTGLMFMGVSNHFLMLYLSIETVSILSFTLAGFRRERTASVEASMKYVVYGAMASALMVFGMSLVYGATGHMDLISLREFFSSTATSDLPNVLWAGVILMFAGIGYKVSAAPMHMWTPDVYEGAPTPVTALFSVAPKAAGFALLMRFFITGFSLPVQEGAAAVAQMGSASAISFYTVGPVAWTKLLMISSVFTMFMGNLAALGQFSVKRILAYSSIAHAGYILMGATTQSFEGLTAIIFYLVVYCFMNFGAFWVTSKVEDCFGGDGISEFRGLGSRKPIHAACMAIFLFSLVGLPPFAGFIGKVYLFSAVLAREMYGFALIAALNSVISLFYYVKIIRAMYLDEAEVAMPEGKTSFDSRVSLAFIVLLALPNLVLGIYWEPVMKVAKNALNFFVGM